jgi:DNA-binding NtrC family response regulator
MPRTSHAPSRPSSKAVSRRKTRRIGATSRRVLFVDKDIYSLRQLRQALGEDWNVTTAAGESQAQILLDAFDYRAIISSHEQGGQNGIRLLEWARARHPGVMRFLTTECEPAVLAPHLLSGLVQRFLAKPINHALLLEALGETHA